MSLKKLYADALLGETLREFRKGRKYIGGDEDKLGEQVAKKRRIRGIVDLGRIHRASPKQPRQGSAIVTAEKF